MERNSPGSKCGDTPVPRCQLLPLPSAVRAGWDGGLTAQESGISLAPMSLPCEHPLWGLAVEGSPLPGRGQSDGSTRLTCIPEKLRGASQTVWRSGDPRMVSVSPPNG